MFDAEMLDKPALRRLHDRILDAGCLDAAQRARLRAGEHVPGVVVQQSSGSAGGPPLRLPKGPAETAWLIERLIGLHRQAFGDRPARIAFVGGVTHLEAGRVENLFPGGSTRSFRLEDWDGLVDHQPDFLSCYPSVARDLVVRSAERLRCLRTLKLGGEPVLPADRARLLSLLPGLLIIEQFGSTEMPGLSFRATTRAQDSGHVLSRDRYDFRLSPPGDGWRELVVRDRFPTRAFPIPGWYGTGDEAHSAGEQVLQLRRKNDPATPFLGALDDLVARGLAQVQLDLRSGRLLHQALPGVTLPARLVLAGQTFCTESAPIHRLRDSNKAPLALGADLPAHALWSGEEVA